MRDDDHRAAVLEGIERVFDLPVSDGIEAGGGLVEEDDGRGVLELDYFAHHVSAFMAAGQRVSGRGALRVVC